MKTIHRILATGLLAAGALGAAGVAQARSDVYWSLGVGTPGVAVGVGNVPAPVYPAPAYYPPPPPVYYQPRPYYAPPPVYYAPPRVVYRPAPVYYGRPGYHRHHNRFHAGRYYRYGGSNGF